MLHSSITLLYTKQKDLFRRFISLSFTMAGVYWLFMYGFELADWITKEQAASLRSGQSIIYFVLLTLWGVEYLRESRRLGQVMEIANTERLSPDEVELEALHAKGAFGVLKPINGASPIMPIINWVGLAVSTILIVMQYMRLVASI